VPSAEPAILVLPPVEPSPIVDPRSAASPGVGRRNPFAYGEMRRAPPPFPPPLAEAVALPVPVPEPRPAEPETPAIVFPYRFIGRIGPHDDPIAVFLGDGELLNVRRGQRIGDGFVLRSFGIESVEVEPVRDPTQALRVPFR
jgi:hypothetical protein